MPADQRRVSRRGLARIDPDDPVRQPPQPAHRLGDLLGVVGRPAVGEHDDDGAAGQPAAAVLGDEPADALGQPGAAGPVRRPSPRRGRAPGRGRGTDSSRVSRVSRVEKTKASARAPATAPCSSVR